MDLTNVINMLNQYIRSELIILIPVLGLIGMFIKKTRFKNENIPFIQLGVSLVLSMLYTLGTVKIDNVHTLLLALFSGITQGVLIAGSVVYGDVLKYIINMKAAANEDSSKK